MEYYSPMKRKEVLIHVATWIKLGNNILSERSLAQMATYYLIPLTGNTQDGQIHRERK